MSATRETAAPCLARRTQSGSMSRRIWRRALLASTAALSLGAQDAAWATCSDGSQLPASGFVIGLAPLQTAANWSPHVFTGTAGSLFIPDNSVYEHNDPKQPKTGGGHNWVFDQGSTLCKETDVGPAEKKPAWHPVGRSRRTIRRTVSSCRSSPMARSPILAISHIRVTSSLRPAIRPS